MPNPSPITILLADDHPMFRDGVRQALTSDSSFVVVAVVSDGEQALKSVKDYSPDVAVLDMNMPKMTGLGVLKELKNLKSKTEVVFLTMFDDEDILNEAIDLGVKGYILKESASVDIVNAVHAALEGRYYISPALTNKLLKRKEKQKSFAASHPQLQALTPARTSDSKNDRRFENEQRDR